MVESCLKTSTLEGKLNGKRNFSVKPKHEKNEIGLLASSKRKLGRVRPEGNHYGSVGVDNISPTDL